VTPATQPDAAIVVRRESGARRAERQVSLACFENPFAIVRTATEGRLLSSTDSCLDGVEARHELTPPKYC
jgi:hypothetical protein